jgi:hypothetical protein
MPDFTLKTYAELLAALISKNYGFITFRNFMEGVSSQTSFVILRHDVDLLPDNALQMAILENQFGLRGTYYFRIIPESFNLPVMQKIADLGHEIGYHYEDMDLAHKRYKESEEVLIEKAYESFCHNLKIFQKHFDIKTVCMHGSPRARYDNKVIWSKYDYKQLGLIGEPYFDINFNECAYFTDTGRRWNASQMSIRDKVNSAYRFNFKTTYHIIENSALLPPGIMFNIHPQRWHNRLLPWAKELIVQNVKNIIKYYIASKKQKQSTNF